MRPSLTSLSQLDLTDKDGSLPFRACYYHEKLLLAEMRSDLDYVTG